MKIRTHAKPIIAAGLCLAITATSLMIAACDTAGGAMVMQRKAPASERADSSMNAAGRWEPATSTNTPAPQSPPRFAGAPEFDLHTTLGGRPNGDAAPPSVLDYPSDWPKVTYSRGNASPTNRMESNALQAYRNKRDMNGDGDFTDSIAIQGNDITRADKETELLIIERRHAAHRAEQDTLGCGGLITTIDEKQVTVPLKHTDVKASIAGYISAVNVTQQFTNPYTSKIEAVYVFPLPENAAISDFIMTIGDRHIRGIIREREQAEQIYAQARAQGHTASLLTQERPNIFTQKVANIEPGKQIDINITYYSTLTYSDGGYEFTFPMVVGPRFNPPGTTDGIGAAPRNNPAQPNATEITYLRPTERTGHDISLSLDIDAGVSMESMESRTHKIDVKRLGESRARVTLSKLDSIPNRDFVLKWQVAGESIKSTLLAHTPDNSANKGGYFTMMLVPPKDLKFVPRNPVELVFVLDRSGSMNGIPMRQAQAAISRGLERLQPGDSFQIIDFSEDASQMGPAPVEATETSIAKGQRYLATLDAHGGTYMIKGLRASLDFPHDPRRLRFVTFCTDGFIGNEAEILGEVHKRLGSSRIFSLGVGSCNRYLMDSMARMGSGVATYLDHKDSAATVMDAFFDRISHAPLADLKVDWAGAHITEVFPSRVPDLFVGRPVILAGRYQGELPSSIRVHGLAGGDRHTIEVRATRSDSQLANAALSQVWARAKLTEIADQSAWDTSNPELTQTAKRTALDYNLMSPFTAFVAVDTATRTAGDYGTTVNVPVPTPQGTRYDTTVEGR